MRQSLYDYFHMFSLKRCEAQDCSAYTFDGGEFCYHHSPEKDEIKKSVIYSMLNAHALRDRSIAAADFRNIEMKKGLRITGMNFSFCVFDNCIFTNSIIISSFFDFCLFLNCRMTNIEGRYAVFSGSTFYNCTINDSVIIHSNFMGIETDSCDFSGNDFYYSNFSLSRLLNTSLDDCNLKRTSFRSAMTKGVTFRYSNPEEAYLRKEDV